MAIPKIVADFTTQLSVAIAVGGTTGTLYSNTDDDGVALPTGLYYFTIDGTNSAKEHISCTNTGGTLTNIKTVSRQGIETSGAARAHRVGASVVMTDFATYKNYIDQATISGISPATTTTLGGVYTTTNTASSKVVSDDDPRVNVPAATTALAVLPYIYPIGCIYMSIVSTNPNTVMGFGTWVAWGAGRVPVGVDAGQTEFDTVEETGGEKTHKLTVEELAAHKHTFGNASTNGGATSWVSSATRYNSVTSGNDYGMDNAGSDTPHNNLQPYITCYMFKRTA